MRRSALFVAAVILAGAAPLAHAAAPPRAREVTRSGHGAMRVTGHVRPPVDYVRSGLTPRAASALATLDQLGRTGVDRAYLQQVATAFHNQQAPDTYVSSGSSGFTALLVAGDLDGRPGKEVLEQRVLQVGSTTIVQVLARDGLTGAVLWTRKDALDKNAMEFVQPGSVQGHPGAYVIRWDSDHYPDLSLTLRALDGRGRQVWSRTVTVKGRSDPAPSPDPSSFTFSWNFLGLDVDVPLRRGPKDVLVTSQRDVESYGTVTSSRSGDLRFWAVSSGDGRQRDVAGGMSSTDSEPTGGLVGDQDGDGLADLVIVDPGAKHDVIVRRAVDGVAVWHRTDLVTNGFAWVVPVGRLTGAKAQDLALVAVRQPGKVGSVDVPFVATVADPTAGTIGQVTLLAGRTGTTVWSKPGTDVYPLARAGTAALGVLSDLSADSLTAITAKATVAVYDAKGTGLWSVTRQLTVAHAAGDQSDFAYAFGFPLSDLDGDGGLEGLVELVVFTQDKETYALHLLRSKDGAALKDTTSWFLLGGVTAHGQDRFVLTPGKPGLTLKVLSGRDGHPLFTRVVPRSTGLTSGDASAVPLGAGPCGDVLVIGRSASRYVVSVLASDGSPRWTVARDAIDLQPGALLRPAHAPHPRCR